MSQIGRERLSDILAAIDRCMQYKTHLGQVEAEIGLMAYDAVLRNLGVIGEAVRALPEDVKSSMPDIPWSSIGGLRNVIIHEYFRIDPALVLDVVDNHLEPLAIAIRRHLSE